MDNLAEIVRIDKQIAGLRAGKVITLADINTMRQLKEERGWQVAVIQNYKPTGQVH